MIENREQVMVSPSGGKPTSDSGPELPPLSRPSPSDDPMHPLKVIFNGFPQPQPKWEQWLEKMIHTHYTVWKKAGIHKAIMGSIYKIPRNDQVICGLARRWCSQSNTFFFLFGEATITLEDMVVLGGFSVLGGPFSLPLESQQLVAIQEELEKERQELRKSNGFHKVEHSQWLEHFMGKGSKVEHEAFLSLWLSTYVFPRKSYECINKSVFPIAIHLARGTRIALAPPVLASIYKDLTRLRQATDAVSSQLQLDNFNLVAPLFVLVQTWAWERFVELRPKPRFLYSREPRLARWHGVEVSPVVHAELVLGHRELNFVWRPYTIAMDEWRPPKFYKEKGGWFLCDSDSAEGKELASFICCLRDGVMVGLGRKEHYLPSRVAMQFGLDQDVPGSVLPSEPITTESFSNMCSQLMKGAKFYVPPRLFESGITVKYSEWWKSLGIGPQDAIKPFIKGKRSPRIPKSVPWGSIDQISTLNTEYFEQSAKPVVDGPQCQAETSEPKEPMYGTGTGTGTGSDGEASEN